MSAEVIANIVVRAIIKIIKITMKRVWVLANGRRNEALDCRVYGFAALHILNPNLEALAQDKEKAQINQQNTRQKQQQDWIGVQDWNFN